MTRRRWCLSRVEIDDSSWRLSRISNSPYRDLPIESISFRLLRTCLQRNHLFHFFLKKNVVTTLPFHVIIDDQWQIDTHVDVWIVVYVSFSIFSTSWKTSESSRRIHPSMKRQHKWSLRLCYLDRKFVIISRAHPEVMTDNPNYSIAMIRYVKYLKWKTMSGKKKNITSVPLSSLLYFGSARALIMSIRMNCSDTRSSCYWWSWYEELQSSSWHVVMLSWRVVGSNSRLRDKEDTDFRAEITNVTNRNDFKLIASCQTSFVITLRIVHQRRDYDVIDFTWSCSDAVF